MIENRYGKMKERDRSKKEPISGLEASQRLTKKYEKLKVEYENIKEVLRKVEFEKTAILNAMFEYVLFVNRDMKMVWSSEPVRRQLLIEDSKIKDQYCYKVFAQSMKICKSCPIKKAIEIKESITREDVRFPSFPEKRWLIRYYPVSDEGCIVAYTDITESKRVEEELLKEQKQKDSILADIKRSEEKYRKLFEDSRDAIFIITNEGGFTDANKACLDLLGVGMKELDKMHLCDFIAISREKERIFRDVDKRKDLIDYPIKLRRKGGSVIDCLFTPSVRNGHNGGVLGYQGIIRDITEQKKLEKELLEISERERRGIGQDLHDSLGQLLTGIALKGKSMAQSLKKSSSEAKQAQQLTDLANEAINQTRNLIKGLVPVNLKAGGILTALQEMANNINQIYGITCKFNCNCSEIRFSNITANQLYSIAQEATINAVKHSKAKMIQIGLDEMHDRIIMSIKDDGIGLSLKEGISDGRGLQIMQYRAKMIDARLSIRHVGGRGVKITCTISKEQLQP